MLLCNTNFVLVVNSLEITWALHKGLTVCFREENQGGGLGFIDTLREDVVAMACARSYPLQQQLPPTPFLNMDLL